MVFAGACRVPAAAADHAAHCQHIQQHLLAADPHGCSVRLGRQHQLDRPVETSCAVVSLDCCSAAVVCLGLWFALVMGQALSCVVARRATVSHFAEGADSWEHQVAGGTCQQSLHHHVYMCLCPAGFRLPGLPSQSCRCVWGWFHCRITGKAAVSPPCTEC